MNFLPRPLNSTQLKYARNFTAIYRKLNGNFYQRRFLRDYDAESADIFRAPLSLQ